MANLWDDIARTIRDGLDTVVEKTEELTKMGKIKVDIINIKRNVDKNFSELGGKVYHLIVEENKTKVTDQKDIQDIIDSVKILEKELEEKNLALKKIKSKGKANSKPDTGKKPEAKARTRSKAKSPSTTKAKSSSSQSKQTTST